MHLHFHSDDKDGYASDSFHHHDVGFPVHQHQNQPLYGAQRPMTPETMRMGDSSSSYFPYASYCNGGFFLMGHLLLEYYRIGTFNLLQRLLQFPMNPPPPPPPPPPISATWEFLNPFESFKKYYPPYTQNRGSREVREDEEIPDFEDEDDVVVEEVHDDQKFLDRGKRSYAKPGLSVEDAHAAIDQESQYNKPRPSVVAESDPLEYEVHMVDIKVVNAKERSQDRGNATGFKPRGGFKGFAEFVREIKVQLNVLQIVEMRLPSSLRLKNFLINEHMVVIMVKIYSLCVIGFMIDLV